MLEIVNSGKQAYEQDIKKVEQVLGFSFPQEYRLFLLKFNGGESNRSIFLFKQDNTSSLSDIRYFLEVSCEDSSLLGEIQSYKVVEKRMPIQIVPIGYDSVGNAICISCSGDDEGKIYFWDHENEVDYTVSDDSDYSNLHLIANSFNEFLDGLMTEEEYDAYEEAQKEKR